MEANLSNSDGDVDQDFSFLRPLDLITKDVYELQQMMREKRKIKDREKEKEKQKDNNNKLENVPVRERARLRGKKRHERNKEIERDRERVEREKVQEKHLEVNTSREMAVDQDDKNAAKHVQNGTTGGPESINISTTSTSQTCEIHRSGVMILEGHTSMVCACAWSPTGSLLASGSEDSTTRIWRIGEGAFRSGAESGPLDVFVLRHVEGRANEKNKYITTMDWNSEGTLLATGSFDGHAMVWSTSGEQKATLSKHKGPVLSLKWNKKGNYLLSGAADKKALVWDVKAKEWKQQFEFHSDTMIYVCKVGDTRPVKSFVGHRSEVNCVKWDPTDSLLASCSDDMSAKIRSIKQDKYVHDLREHYKEAYNLRWSPTGPGTNNPNKQLLLASASLDSTVKLWDVEIGKSLCSLNGHRDPVYSVAFSPNSEYLATGSLDKCVNIWSLKDGKVVKTYTGNWGVYEVCWNKEGDKIAACLDSKVVCVLDFRM